MKKGIVVFLVAALVPLYVVFTFITRGALEPHIPGSNGWNIEYFAHVALAAIAAAIAIGLRKRLGMRWCVGLVTWNTLLAAFALYATVSLWADRH